MLIPNVQRLVDRENETEAARIRVHMNSFVLAVMFRVDDLLPTNDKPGRATKFFRENSSSASLLKGSLLKFETIAALSDIPTASVELSE